MALVALLGSMTASAYSFYADNEQGQTIYYNITDATNHTVSVTYKLVPNYGDVYDKCTDLVIPSTVVRSNTTYTVTGIGEYAFYGADCATITLPNTIVSIGNYAFYACSQLTTLTIPENVTSIGYNDLHFGRKLDTLYYNAINAEATFHDSSYGMFICSANCEVIIGPNVEHIPNYFLNRSSIESIVIPSNVTSIGQNAFSYCTGLTSIVIPANVTSIGSMAFSGCSSLTTVFTEATVPPTIESNTFPNRSSQILIVPAGCGGTYGAAEYWSGFKEIIEPTRIIFADANVEAVCVANWDKNVDGYLDRAEALQINDLGTAFQSNTQISTFAELVLFSGLKAIADNAFSGCSGLAAIAFPENVKTIGSNAFSGCTGLTSITLPEKVTLGSYAFEGCSNLFAITNLNKATALGDGVFKNCTSLNTVTLPTTLTSVSGFFEGCTALSSITLPSSVKYITNSSFKGCSALTSIQLPSALLNIGESAFEGSAISSISIPATVTAIGENAFANCASLLSVTVNWTTPLTLPASAFPNRTNQTLYVPEGTRIQYATATVWKDFKWLVAPNLQTIVFADARVKALCVANWDVDGDGELQTDEAASVTTLGEVFKGNAQIQTFNELQYFKKLTAITGSAFQNCTDLTAFTLPTTVTTISSSAFAGCTGLTSITLPATVTILGEGVFAGCTGLTSVSMLGNITQINRAFEGCTALASVTLKQSTTQIINSAFKGCTALTSIQLPSTLQVIGESAFEGSGLTEIDLPSSLNSIQSNAFADCASLTTVTANWTLPINIDESVFPNRASQLLYVPEGTGSTYRGADVWKEFKWIISGNYPYAVYEAADSTLTFYCDQYPLSHPCTKYYELNEGSINPDWYADGNYANITKVVFDESFTNARPTSTYAWFFRMTNLTEIVDIENLNTSEVTTMRSMFNSCSNLANIDLSHFITANVTSMAKLFSGCSSLTSLNVSGLNTANVIDMNSMFSGCSSLTSLDVSGFNTSKVTDMSYMFDRCSNLTSLDLKNFNTQHVTNMSFMFYHLFNLTSLDVSSFITENVTDMAYMFACSSTSSNNLTSLDLSSFNTAKVTDMQRMFIYCGNLTNIYASSEWSTESINSSDYMFYGCTNLKGHKGTVYDANHVDAAYAHIDGGTDNPGYFVDLSYNDTPYALLSTDGTLTFYKDGQRLTRTENTYDLNEGSNNPGWYSSSMSVRKVVFDESFDDVRPTSTYNWFATMTYLNSISNIEYLHTDDVTTMRAMFSGCRNLGSIDVSHFITSSVTSMAYMFSNCKLITQLDLSNFNTGCVNDMSYMFNQCTNLDNLNVKNFYTYNVTTMEAMFTNCSSLTSLDLRSFNTNNVTTIQGMFSNCSSLTSLDLRSFNTAKVTNFQNIFNGCSNLVTIYAGNWSNAALKYDSNMFTGCTSIKGGQGTVYDSGHVNFAYAHIDGGPSNPGYFSIREAYACYTPGNTTLTFYFDNQRSSRAGTTYDLNQNNYEPDWFAEGHSVSISKVVFDPSFVAARPDNTYYWFGEMSELKTIEGIEYLNTSEVTSMNSMFIYCGMESVDLSTFDTSKVEDMGDMFNGCFDLRTIYVGIGWSTANVTNSSSMFQDCESLVGGRGTTYDANHIDGEYACIDDAPRKLGYFSGKGAFLLGDVNGDGQITIADVTALVNIILGKDTTGQYNHAAADVNQDNQITIADVTALVNIILGKN